MKTLLVGRDPAREPGQGDLPFVGSQSGRRLARMCGLDSDEVLPLVFDLANLYPRPVARWLGKDAAFRAETLLCRESGLGRSHVVALGCGVKSAMRLHQPPHEWRFRRGVWVAWTYHPSGRNRALNDGDTREACASFLRSQMEDRVP